MSKYIDDAISFYEEVLNVNLREELKIKYKVLDDIDFFNECKKETGDTDLSDFLVVSIPKNEEDTGILLLINDYVEKNKDNYGLEILYSQLSTVFIQNVYELQLLKKKYNNSILKKAKQGIEIWEDYYSIYLTQNTMREKYIEEIEENNPYNTKQSLRIGLNFLNKAITSLNKDIEKRISLILYAFAKIVIAKPTNSKTVYNIKPFISNKDLKDPIQELYSILTLKTFNELTLLHFIKINKLMNKIVDIFSKMERSINEEN